MTNDALKRVLQVFDAAAVNFDDLILVYPGQTSDLLFNVTCEVLSHVRVNLQTMNLHDAMVATVHDTKERAMRELHMNKASDDDRAFVDEVFSLINALVHAEFSGE